jgi:TetR/AcrR family transcriptional regulator, mexCD-oprJ operon repressor
MAEPAIDHRRAIAERNVEAIVDAADRMLGRGERLTILAVAKEAGLSRVTLYAHFNTKEELLEAVVKRAVARSAEALDAVELDRGPATEVLERVLAVGWRDLDHHNAIAQAAAEQLTPEVLRRTHEALHRRVRALTDRGRREGDFRTDVPAEWLVSSLHALIHAAGDDVRAGRMPSEAALDALTTTVRDVFVGGARRG